MPIPIYHVDAFAEKPFEGNPAAICLLKDERPAAWMQSVAAEMNLSETAFVRKLDEGYDLRWFTPTIEIELCGHATLASAYAMWSEGVVASGQAIRFHTKSGVLTCTRAGDLIELDFPSTPAMQTEPPAALIESLGIRPSFVGRTKFDKFLVVQSEEIVRSLKPNFPLLGSITGMRGVIVTSPSSDPRFDFVSRY